MGRVHRPGSNPRPGGPRWDAYRQQLIAGWWRSGRACWYCLDGFTAPQLIEVAHIIAPLLRPDLAWSRENLVPSHGGGKGRCPACLIACNQASHQAPDAPRDPKTGASLPFTPQFMARQTELRKRFLAKSGGINSRSAKAPRSSPPPFREEPGRPW